MSISILYFPCAFTLILTLLSLIGWRGRLCGRSGKGTTEANDVALVSATLPPEVACIIIRAESLSIHKKWVRALKARLTSKDTLIKMDRLYSS